MNPPRRAVVVHHDADSLIGLLGPFLTERGFEVDERWITPVGDPTDPGDFHRAGPFDLTAADLLVILGSGRSVYEPAVAHWVQPELDLVRRCDIEGIAVVGICFGHQLAAAAFGGHVEPTTTPEIGWHRIEPSPGSPIPPGPWFQWHLDHVTLPDGATPWAHSAGGLQAFRLRRCVGVQFHPEIDASVLAAWIATDRHWLSERSIDGDALLQATADHLDEARGRTWALFDTLLLSVGH